MDLTGKLHITRQFAHQIGLKILGNRQPLSLKLGKQALE
jgi:hypothetical protein